MEPMDTKTCFVCGKALPIDDFYRHPMMADGHLGKCKECCKKQAHGYRRARLDHWREYDRNRFQTPERKAAAYETTKKLRQLYPEKNRARYLVGKALKKGELQRQPCAICGATKVEAHHRDYSKPLDVVWLCRSCHFKIHFDGVTVDAVSTVLTPGG